MAVTTYAYDRFGNLGSSTMQALPAIGQPAMPMREAAKGTYVYTSSTPLPLGNEVLL